MLIDKVRADITLKDIISLADFFDNEEVFEMLLLLGMTKEEFNALICLLALGAELYKKDFSVQVKELIKSGGIH